MDIFFWRLLFIHSPPRGRKNSSPLVRVGLKIFGPESSQKVGHWLLVQSWGWFYGEWRSRRAKKTLNGFVQFLVWHSLNWSTVFPPRAKTSLLSHRVCLKPLPVCCNWTVLDENFQPKPCRYDIQKSIWLRKKSWRKGKIVVTREHQPSKEKRRENPKPTERTTLKCVVLLARTGWRVSCTWFAQFDSIDWIRLSDGSLVTRHPGLLRLFILRKAIWTSVVFAWSLVWPGYWQLSVSKIKADWAFAFVCIGFTSSWRRKCGPVCDLCSCARHVWCPQLSCPVKTFAIV